MTIGSVRSDVTPSMQVPGGAPVVLGMLEFAGCSVPRSCLRGAVRALKRWLYNRPDMLTLSDPLLPRRTRRIAAAASAQDVKSSHVSDVQVGLLTALSAAAPAMFTVLSRAYLDERFVDWLAANDSLAHQSLFNAIQPVIEYDWAFGGAGVDLTKPEIVRALTQAAPPMFFSLALLGCDPAIVKWLSAHAPDALMRIRDVILPIMKHVNGDTQAGSCECPQSASTSHGQPGCACADGHKHAGAGCMCRPQFAA